MPYEVKNFENLSGLAGFSDTSHFSGCVLLLVLDVFEHAYMLDYGIKRADYIEAFMKAIDWEAVGKRLIV